MDGNMMQADKNYVLKIFHKMPIINTIVKNDMMRNCRGACVGLDDTLLW